MTWSFLHNATSASCRVALEAGQTPQIHRHEPHDWLNKEIPVLDWCLPEGPRRRLVRWMTVPGPDSKEISDATSIWWLSSV
jgi:hypothetical protein